MELRSTVFFVCFMASVALGQEGEAPAVATDEALNNVTPTFEMTPEQQEEFRDVAEMLRCPTCQGLSVLESDATFSRQIQARVKEQIAEGKSREQILDYFTERYGNWILREPPRKGVNMVAWLFPIGLLLLGPLGIWFFVWRRRKDIPTMGVRSREALVEEFERMVKEMRASGKGAAS